jgi:PAS domain S-box-containing protein
VASNAPAFPVVVIILRVILVIATIAAVQILLSQKKVAEDMARLAENANRVRQRQKIAPLIVNKDIMTVDKALHEISADLGEFQRKEHSVINHAVDVICSIGHDQCFLSVNPAVSKIWGYKPEELIGTRFADLLIEEDREKSMQALFGAEQSVDTLSFENRVKKKNGGILDVLWSAHWSAADQALFCVAHDITARKLAEKLLEESEHRIRQIFEDMPVGLIMANRLGIIEMSNPTLNTMYGAENEAELIGKHIQVILSELIRSVGAPDYHALLNKLTDSVLWRKSGGSVPVNVSARELSMGDDKKYLLVLLDTSERERLDQLKREFFAMVSHDLRSPLTSLLHMLDSLEAGHLGELNPRGSADVERNQREISRLIKLVDELLDIEKMKSGKFVIEAEFCRVDAIMDPSIAALEHFAKRRDIEIVYAKNDLMVYADSSLLIRVLVNLLSNAVKFSPSKSVINISVIEKDGQFEFSVKDAGRGVPAEFRQRIFEQYEQVEKSDATAKGGTGLGLPICKMIVEQHGGRIWVESSNGNGSEFKFSIPRHMPGL